MKAILREVVLLASSITVLAGFQNSVPKTPAIPPKTLSGPDQPPTPLPNFRSSRERPLAITADKRTVSGKAIQYQGHVIMTTDSVIVTADELNFDTATQSAKAMGNVAIKMRPVGSLIVPVGQ